MKNLKPLILGMFTGIMVALACPLVFDFPWFFPFALIPWFLVVEKKNMKNMLISSIGLSFAFNVVLYFWIPLALTTMWKFPLLISWSLFLPLTLFTEFNYFVSAWIYNKFIIKYNNYVKILGFSAVFTGVESLFRTVLPDDLGFFAYNFSVFRQALDLSSTSVFTFWIWVINLSVFFIIKSKDKKLVSIPLLISSLIYGYAFMRNNYIDSQEKIFIKSLIIQPNIHHAKRDSSRLGEVPVVENLLNTQFEQTLKSMSQEVDLVLWPETTYPFFFGNPSNIYQQSKEEEMINFLSEYPNVGFFFGSFSNKNENMNINNNVFGIYGKDREVFRFKKSVLFPFGEYVPGVKYFPFLNNFFPSTMNAIERTTEPEVLKFRDINLGSLICYEVNFIESSLNMARKDIQLSVNVTNESWFYKLGEPQLTLFITAVRAAESRMSVVRSGNTGISAVIDYKGNILTQTSYGTVDTILYDVPVLKNPVDSIFKQYGDWFSKLCLFISFIFIIMGLYKGKKKE